MFFKHSKNGKISILLVYVGDTILTSNNMHEMEILKQLMAKEFEAKNLGA